MASDPGSVTMNRSLVMTGSVCSKHGRSWTQVPRGPHPSIWPRAPFCANGVGVGPHCDVLFFGITSI